MLLFLLGAVCGVILTVVLTNLKPENNHENGTDSTKMDLQKAQSVTITNNNENKVVSLNIPVSVLSNLYSLSIENKTVKYKKKRYSDGNTFEYLSIDCELHYKLNGRKEGKRCFVFSYYDQDGNVISHNQTDAFYFTEAGMELVHRDYDVLWDSLPKSIGISVREVS